MKQVITIEREEVINGREGLGIKLQVHFATALVIKKTKKVISDEKNIMSFNFLENKFGNRVQSVYPR